MSTYTDAKQWADAFAQRLDKKARSAQEAHRMLAYATKDDLYRLLSGGISSDELEAAGHPFGRNLAGGMRGLLAHRKGKAGVLRRKYPIYPVNVQTGLLRSSLTLSQMKVPGSIQSFDLYSTAPYAKYILNPLGTTFMVGRDILTGHALGKQAPGQLERYWRAKNRVVREALGNS